jgi:CP family cyanate transporter-like MFS transporter
VLLWTGFGMMAVGAWLTFSPWTQPAPWLGYLGAVMFSALGGLIPGTLFGIAPLLAPDERAISTTVGWMLQGAALGQVVGPPAVAWLASATGTWHWTWVLTGACCATGAWFTGHIARRITRAQASRA